MSGLEYLLQLTIMDNSGREYSLSLPSGSTLENLKQMAINYFLGQAKAKITKSEGGSSGSGSSSSSSSNASTFGLVLLRGTRTLNDDASTLHSKKLINSDILLLVSRRAPPPPSKDLPLLSPTQTQIDTATAHIEKRNENCHFNISPSLVDIDVLIKSSVRLISADPNANNNETFVRIFELLEHHKVLRHNLKFQQQLLQMGFDKVRVNEALVSQKDMDLEGVIDWLLDDRNGPAIGNNSGAHLSIENITTQLEDPGKVFFREFLRCLNTWFTINENALDKLVEKGYPRERVIEALQMTGNLEAGAENYLAQNLSIDKDKMANSPIIAALSASTLIRKGLVQPKNLYALLRSFFSKETVDLSMWVNDIDTKPFFSNILEIINLEKHWLSHS